MCFIDRIALDPFQWTPLLLLSSSQYDPFKSQLTGTYNSQKGTLKTQLEAKNCAWLNFSPVWFGCNSGYWWYQHMWFNATAKTHWAASLSQKHQVCLLKGKPKKSHGLNKDEISEKKNSTLTWFCAAHDANSFPHNRRTISEELVNIHVFVLLCHYLLKQMLVLTYFWWSQPHWLITFNFLLQNESHLVHSQVI